MSHTSKKVDEGELRRAALELGAMFSGIAACGLILGERSISPVVLGAAMGVAAMEAMRRWVIWCSPEARREDLP